MNNCKICGKELSDGRRKICKECAEKEKKEKEEMKAKKAENNKTIEKNKQEVKTEIVDEIYSGKNENNKKATNKPIIFIIIIAILVICLILGVILSKNDIGNTIGNIRNYGYAATDKNYIYYLAPNDDSSAVGIFKIKKDGKGESKQLYMEDLDIVSINVYNGYIYFIGIGTEAFSEDDEVDNKIYRMKTNGDNLTVINDNEFSNDCYEIYVLNNSVYYIGTDNNIYKMALNGSKRSLVSDSKTGYLGLTDKYIIYNKEVEGQDDFTTYIMNIDGSNQRPLIDGERLYSVNIQDDYVYYTNQDKQICKTKIDSNESQILLDTTAYNMNLKDEYIYFLNYKDIENEDYTVCLYRIKADGSEQQATTIKELDTYSSFIDIVGDWVIYMDSNDKEGFINFVKTDGSSEVRVFSLNYEEYYQSISSQDGENTETTEATETTEVTNTTEDTAPENTTTTEQNVPENTTTTEQNAPETTTEQTTTDVDNSVDGNQVAAQ